MLRLNLGNKLALLVSIPLLGMLFFSGRSALEKWEVWKSYERLEDNSKVLIQLGEVVHQLQKERGRSSVFINSKGERMVNELPEERRTTDGQITKLQNLLKTFQPSIFGVRFESKYNEGLSALTQLAGMRTGISSLSVSSSDSLRYYTQTIANLLDVVVEMSHLSEDARIAKGIQAYVNYLQSKEQAGIERASLAGAFSQDQFTDALYQTWSRSLASQEVFERVFTTFASPEQIAFSKEQVSGAAVDAVVKFRNLANAKKNEGSFGVPPAQWFEASTKRIDLMKNVENRLGKDYESEAKSIQAAAWKSLITTCSIAFIILLASLVLSFLEIRSLLIPIHACTSALQQLSTGNLDAEVGFVRQDELGTLAVSVDVCILNLRNLIGGVAAASKELVTSAKELQTTAISQAASAEETTMQATTVASAGEELAANSQTMAKASQQINLAANSVAAAMEEMSASVQEVAQNCAHESQIAQQADMQAGKTRQMMNQLDESSHQIGKIVEMISNIADQTNLLALNATIEAASAGEAGRGFAVVANEVKALAKQSADATEEIKEQIMRIQDNIGASVKSIDDVAQIIQEVSHTASSIASASEEQSATTAEIVRSIHEVTNASSTLSENVQHATEGTAEVARNISGVSEAAAESAKGSSFISASSDSINTLAANLNQQIGGFSMSSQKESPTKVTIGKAIVAHGAWKKRLFTAIETGKSEMKPEHVCLDNRCDFGKWLYEADAQLQSTPRWQCLRAKHAEFHQETGQILQLAISGKSKEAAEKVTPTSRFIRFTTDLTQELLKWRKDA